MAHGKFEGLKEEQWNIVSRYLPPKPQKRGKGMPPVNPRYALNSIVYVLKTGCRWCDLPVGEIWASKSSAHRWMKRWLEEGVLDKLLKGLIEEAHLKDLLKISRLSIDGSFAAGKGGGKEVDYGYKGKGVLTHLLVEGNGLPLAKTVTAANGDERVEALKLIDQIEYLRKGDDHGLKVCILEADKGYDSDNLRIELLKKE